MTVASPAGVPAGLSNVEHHDAARLLAHHPGDGIRRSLKRHGRGHFELELAVVEHARERLEPTVIGSNDVIGLDLAVRDLSGGGSGEVDDVAARTDGSQHFV